MHESEKWKWSRSVLSDPQRPHGLQPTRLLHPWDFPGRSTGLRCHCLLRVGRGPTLIVVCGLLIVVASLVPEHWFQSAGSVFVAHRHSCLLGSLVACVSFPDRNQIPLYCIGRWILNHCTTREFLIFLYFMITVFFWDIFYSLCVTLVWAPQSGDSCLLDMRIKKMISLIISSSLFYVLLFWNTPSNLTLQISFIVSLFLLFFGGWWYWFWLFVCLLACFVLVSVLFLYPFHTEDFPEMSGDPHFTIHILNWCSEK